MVVTLAPLLLPFTCFQMVVCHRVSDWATHRFGDWGMPGFEISIVVNWRVRPGGYGTEPKEHGGHPETPVQTGAPSNGLGAIRE